MKKFIEVLAIMLFTLSCIAVTFLILTLILNGLCGITLMHWPLR